MRVSNCPRCSGNLIVRRAMVVSTLLPSASGIDHRGDSAPACGAFPKRKGGAIKWNLQGRAADHAQDGYRILKLQRWFVHQRPAAPRPRVQGRRSRAARSNERWATDLTHIHCGAGGWAHQVAVIDCYDREIVGGYDFKCRGQAKEAERAL